jgi:biopolymer transport protein ExbD
MKIKGAKAVHYDSGPNMTPLVDVVMVILIFLMLVGQFDKLEHYLVSNLPYTEKGLGGAKPPEGFVPDEPLDIRVDSPTPDKWVANAGRISTSDARSLTAALTRMRDEFKAAGKGIDKIQVVISPGRDVKYEYLIGVYEAAMRAEFTKISFKRAH